MRYTEVQSNHIEEYRSRANRPFLSAKQLSQSQKVHRICMECLDDNYRRLSGMTNSSKRRNLEREVKRRVHRSFGFWSILIGMFSPFISQLITIMVQIIISWLDGPLNAAVGSQDKRMIVADLAEQARYDG